MPTHHILNRYNNSSSINNNRTISAKWGSSQGEVKFKLQKQIQRSKMKFYKQIKSRSKSDKPFKKNPRIKNKEETKQVLFNISHSKE